MGNEIITWYQFLDTLTNTVNGVSWENIEEVQDFTFYDILTEPAFKCTELELMYFDKFKVSLFSNIESFSILWNIEHSHHIFLRNKHFKTFLFKLYVIKSILSNICADSDEFYASDGGAEQIKFLKENHYYFTPENVLLYHQELKPYLKDVVVPINKRLATLAMPRTDRMSKTNKANSEKSGS